MTTSSFIANVNLLVQYVEEMKNLNSSLDAEKIETLLELSRINVQAIAEDLSKDTYLGNKKISINLLENYKDYSSEMLSKDLELLYKDSNNQVRYDRLEVLFSDFTIKTLYFNQSGIYSYVLTNEELFTQLTSLLVVENGILGTDIILVPSDITDYEVLIVDTDTEYSNILKVTLHAVADDPYKQQSVGFAWADYTSALQLAATHLQELLYIANNLGSLLDVPDTTLQLLTQAEEVLNSIQNIYLYVVTTEQYIKSTVETLDNYIEEIDVKIEELEEDILNVTNLAATTENAALNALTSATNAKESETSAESSKVAALSSETNARTSELASQSILEQMVVLEQDVDVDMVAIEASKNSAIASAASALSSATNAESDANTATIKANEATSAADTAVSKATEASQSASSASNSASAANTSEVNAKASEVASKTSETNAKESEDRAKQYRDETEAMTAAGIAPATKVKLGGVIAGDGINIEEDGTISVAEYSTGTGSLSGVLKLSDSTTSISGVSDGVAATPVAVKTAYDKGQEGLTKANEVSSRVDTLDTTKVTIEQVNAAIQAVVSSAPEALDTLNELAKALNDDPNFASTITAQLTAMNQSIGVNTSTANSAKTTAEAAMPKTGGTFTGGIATSSLSLDNVVINIVQDGDRKKMTFTL